MTTLTRRQLLQGAAVAGAAVAGAATVAVPTTAEAAERRARKPDDVGLLYDSTLCIGCRACVTKCKQANELPVDALSINGAPYDAPDDLNATTKTVIQVAAQGDRFAFVKRQCMQCLDPACVSACMIKAYQKGPNGVITYDQSRCLGDRYCQIACPFNVPKFQWAKAVPIMVKCEMCRHRKEGPACSEVCPRAAVISGKVPDLVAEARRRQAASPGKYLARIYGEHEVGGTQCLYLTAADVPFESLGLPKVDETAQPHLSTSIQHGLYKGMIAPVALYAAIGFAVWKNTRGGGDQGKKP
jgi:Fe-S-cluster-containing dehydrogenase component